jgi:hypothetical protein
VRHLILFVLPLIFFSGCSRWNRWDDYRTVKQQEEGALHLYLDPKDTGNSLLGTIHKDPLKMMDTFKEDESYKLWQLPKTFIQGRIVFVDPYYGLFIYKRKYGDPGYYLKVIGAYDIDSTDPYHLIVTTSIGKASINMINPDAPAAESFVFDYPGYGPPISYQLKRYLTRKNFCSTYGCRWKYYFQCPTSSEKIIFGWNAGALTTDPICFNYTD